MKRAVNGLSMRMRKLAIDVYEDAHRDSLSLGSASRACYTDSTPPGAFVDRFVQLYCDMTIPVHAGRTSREATGRLCGYLVCHLKPPEWHYRTSEHPRRMTQLTMTSYCSYLKKDRFVEGLLGVF